MAKPDFRAAASQRLSQEEKLSDSVLSLLKPEGEQHDRAVRQIAVDRITPNPKQPRIAADPAALDDLTASIREHGVLQPILVRPLERGHYEIVAGERRWRAVTALALAMIPAIIEEMSDEQAIEIAVIENLQRENLSPLDEAAIFARMTSELGYSIRKLADKLGKDKGYIENRLRLVAAPADVRALVAERSDTISHAYELMKIDDPARRAELAAQIARGELSLARLKAAVRGESEHPSLGAPAVAPVTAPAPVVVAAPAPAPTPAPAAAPVQAQVFAPIIEATPLTSTPLPAALPAASDAGLTAARESLGNAIEELATILHAIDRADGSVKLNQLDRTNMAKWLQIARNKLDNLAAILRQKGE
ncbi:MAG: ParB/RepB/Spo0J family partition protein [Chloroflexi bacterium]|nr:ParB/RepB/Spo0J family partition protein [Chloroflexota bacterium]